MLGQDMDIYMNEIARKISNFPRDSIEEIFRLRDNCQDVKNIFKCFKKLESLQRGCRKRKGYISSP